MCICVLPPVVCQVLLQLCYPTELVEEPLVYGCQLVDLIDTHSTVEGLKSRDMKQIGCYIHYSLSSSSSSMPPTGAFWKQTSKRFHNVSTDSIINGLWLKSWCKSVSENSLNSFNDCFEEKLLQQQHIIVIRSLSVSSTCNMNEVGLWQLSKYVSSFLYKMSDQRNDSRLVWEDFYSAGSTSTVTCHESCLSSWKRLLTETLSGAF